jgi:hypothetical protein
MGRSASRSTCTDTARADAEPRNTSGRAAPSPSSCAATVVTTRRRTDAAAPTKDARLAVLRTLAPVRPCPLMSRCFYTGDPPTA